MENKKCLIVVCHPNLKNSSINKYWVEEFKKDDSKYEVHDLYKEYPDFKINVKKEQALLDKFENIIFQFPIYWFSSPALLKEWIDKVFEYGWAYGTNGNGLKDKKIGLAVSLGGEESFYKGKYDLNNVLVPFIYSFEFVKSKYLGFYALYNCDQKNSISLKKDFSKYLEFIQKFYK